MGSRTTAAKKKRMAKSLMESLKKARSWGKLLLERDYLCPRPVLCCVLVRIETYNEGVEAGRGEDLFLGDLVEGGHPPEEAVRQSWQAYLGAKLAASGGVQ
jgi:hypothetical protein